MLRGSDALQSVSTTSVSSLGFQQVTSWLPESQRERERERKNLEVIGLFLLCSSVDDKVRIERVPPPRIEAKETNLPEVTAEIANLHGSWASSEGSMVHQLNQASDLSASIQCWLGCYGTTSTREQLSTVLNIQRLNTPGQANSVSADTAEQQSHLSCLNSSATQILYDIAWYDNLSGRVWRTLYKDWCDLFGPTSEWCNKTS